MIRNTLAVLAVSLPFPLYADQVPGNAFPSVYRAQSSEERWSAYVNENFASPGAYLRVLAPAISNHAGNEPAEWGQGADAFMQRFGARLGQVQLQGALYHGSAALLRHETGYLRCGCGGARRLGYALSRTFVSRNSTGRTIPNVSLLGGYYGGGMIATSWFPSRYSPWREGVRSAHVQLGVRTIFNVFREYSPELKRILIPSRRRAAQDSAQSRHLSSSFPVVAGHPAVAVPGR